MTKGNAACSDVDTTGRREYVRYGDTGAALTSTLRSMTSPAPSLHVAAWYVGSWLHYRYYARVHSWNIHTMRFCKAGKHQKFWGGPYLSSVLCSVALGSLRKS